LICGTDRLGERVRSFDQHAAAEPAVHRRLKRVVVGVQKSVPHGGRGGPPERGVKRPPGVACSWLRGIDVAVRQSVDRLGSYVADASGDIAGKLPLHDEVPGLNITSVQKPAPGAAIVYCGRKFDRAAVDVRPRK